MGSTVLVWINFYCRKVADFVKIFPNFASQAKIGSLCDSTFGESAMQHLIGSNNNLNINTTMKINPKNGIEKLIFGMKQNDVTALYGKPDRNYKDEDDNVIFAYNKLKMRLTFYVEEEFKLGYIVASSQELELFGNKIINRKISEVKKDLAAKAITKFTQEEFDTFENYFNEENWMIFQTEFDEVVKFEIGAIINQKDEFDWKFGKK